MTLKASVKLEIGKVMITKTKFTGLLAITKATKVQASRSKVIRLKFWLRANWPSVTDLRELAKVFLNNITLQQ
jgi:hypothetical protein